MERSKIADAMESKKFQEQEIIIKQVFWVKDELNTNTLFRVIQLIRLRLSTFLWAVKSRL